MHTSSVYTLVNGNMQCLTHHKQQKIIKRLYHSPSHQLSCAVVLSLFKTFAVFNLSDIACCH